MLPCVSSHGHPPLNQILCCQELSHKRVPYHKGESLSLRLALDGVAAVHLPLVHVHGDAELLAGRASLMVDLAHQPAVPSTDTAWAGRECVR